MSGGKVGRQDLGALDTLLRLGVVGDLTDEHLIHRFLTSHDEAKHAAFAALVGRHGPMVLSLCNEVLGNTQDAQDAFQATFLVLARKAGSVRRTGSLGSWLHGVALRVSLRARVEAARRRHHERRCAEQKSAELRGRARDMGSWPELHEEIARLPRRYREPVVLHYLEGLTAEETAARIGCPRGTVLSRLSRARERMRRRLNARGFVFSLPPLAAGQLLRGRAACPARLLESTVRAAVGSSSSPTAGAASSEALAASLAKGALFTMTVSKIKVALALALTCALIGLGVQSFGQPGRGRAGGTQDPVRDADHDGDAEREAWLRAALSRFTNDLERNAEQVKSMTQALRNIRATLEEPRPGLSLAAGGVADRLAEEIQSDSARAAHRLVEAVKRHPTRLSNDPGWGYQLYLMDLREGSTILVADEPMPGQQCTGRGRWSHDGTRILFETTGDQWPRARLMALDAPEGVPRLTDLGPGNNPAFSGDDKRIAFALYPEAQQNIEPGVWLMRADGSDRRRLGSFGAPLWSSDGHEFLVNSYTIPTESMVIQIEARRGDIVRVEGQALFSWPSWAGPGTLVSALSRDGVADAIALLDVRKPAETKVVETLWKRGPNLDVVPRWPAYRPDTGECYFVGEQPDGRRIYRVRRGQPAQAESLDVLEPTRPQQHQQLAALEFAPGGRYMLFTANRPKLGKERSR